jgi:hypothetical protein
VTGAAVAGAAVGALVGVESDAPAVGVAVLAAVLPVGAVDVVLAVLMTVVAAWLTAARPVAAPTAAVPMSAAPTRSRRTARSARSRSAGVRDGVFTVKTSTQCWWMPAHDSGRGRWAGSVSSLGRC